LLFPLVASGSWCCARSQCLDCRNTSAARSVSSPPSRWRHLSLGVPAIYHNLMLVQMVISLIHYQYIRISNTNRSKRPVYLFLYDLLVFFTVSEHVLCLFSVLVISSAPCLSSSIFV
jgi:hypothetical protein